MDLVLVLDYSSSALPFQNEIRTLTREFLSMFELSESGPRATVITFDSAPTNIVYWDTPGSYFSTDAAGIEDALVAYTATEDVFGSSTRPDGAFTAAQTAFSADTRTFPADSLQTQRFVLFLTDNAGEDIADTRAAADALKETYGARIFALFWGDTSTYGGGPWQQLFTVASEYVTDPIASDDWSNDFSSMNYLIHVDSVALATQRLSDVVPTVCTGAPPNDPPPPDRASSDYY